MEKRNKWPEHLRKCTALANDSARGTHLPGSPFLHINNYRLPKNIFNWMEIFTSTTDELFAGATAEEAKLRAKNMAEMFNYKLTILEMLGKMAIF
jgi:hemoglobin